MTSYLITDKFIVTVRALLDSGAQRSFVKRDVTQKLHLQPTGFIETRHILFGSSLSKKEKHKVYDLKLKSLDNTYECKIEVLEQENICGVLPSLQKGSI